MKSHDFRRFLTTLSDLNPAQVEDVQMKITTIRRKTQAISEIEARTTTDDAVLCSDGAKGYESAAAKKGVPHVKVGSKAGTRVVSGCYNIQNANSLHARYGAFIRPFCGPSRKFLDGYISWFEMRLEGLMPEKIFRSA